MISCLFYKLYIEDKLQIRAGYVQRLYHYEVVFFGAVHFLWSNIERSRRRVTALRERLRGKTAPSTRKKVVI